MFHMKGDPMSFAHELDRLIKQHVGRPKHVDDFQEVVGALYEAANKWATKADCYRWKDETAREFNERVRGSSL
jgi:hypothetical protein